jgi:hypothetical protein
MILIDFEIRACHCLATLVVQIFLQKMRTKTELVSKDVESIS